MQISKETVLLYAVTDQTVINRDKYPTLYDAVEAALKGGASCIQLREKQLSYDDFLQEAIEIHTLTKKYRVPLIINDNVMLAQACDAEGVHIGQGDMDVVSAREILGHDKIIGVSAHNVKEALEAQALGADYLGTGSVFATKTKNDVSALSFQELRKICTSVSIPVVAIGGINKDNIAKLSASGISGVAVVSSVFGAECIEQETKKLVADVKHVLYKTEVFNRIYDSLKPILYNKSGVVFDMDGTILDSMPMWRNLDVQYLGRFGIYPDKAFHHKVATMTLAQAAEYIKDCYQIPRSAKEMVRDFQEMVYDEYKNHIPLKLLAYELIKVLKCDGYKIAIATANEIELCRLVIKRMKLDAYIDAVVSCTIAGAGKDKPDVFFDACKNMQVSPGACVVFEDSLRAIETAKQAGFTTVGVSDVVSQDVWDLICDITDEQVVFALE